jgi:soluble lytic murein transglycosylase-like protein
LSCFGESSCQQRLARAVAICWCALLAVPANADVIELSPEGVVSVRHGAGAATFDVLDLQAAPASSINVDAPPAAVTRANTLHVPTHYAGMVETAAAAANISPNLLAALVWQESRWNANAVSPKGAIGLAQLMPGTARDLGVDPRNPMANLLGGARYLRQMLNRFNGNLENALAAYNAGPKRVMDAKGVPAIRETRAYVKSVMQRASAMAGGEK